MGICSPGSLPLYTVLCLMLCYCLTWQINSLSLSLLAEKWYGATFRGSVYFLDCSEKGFHVVGIHQAHTHTHTQPFYCWSGICPGPPGSAGTREVKPRRMALGETPLLLPRTAVATRQNAPNRLSAGALPQTPLGELIALPHIPSWISGRPTSKRREGVEGKGEMGWRGILGVEREGLDGLR